MVPSRFYFSVAKTECIVRMNLVYIPNISKILTGYAINLALEFLENIDSVASLIGVLALVV